MAISNSYIPARRRSAAPARGLAPARLIALWRQRRHLAGLDDDQLDDIGLSRAEAEAEAARPFWDIPAHWRNFR